MALPKDPRKAAKLTKDANRLLLDSVIIHAHETERFSAAEAQRIVALLDRQIMPALLSRVESTILSLDGLQGTAFLSHNARYQAMLREVNHILAIYARKGYELQSEVNQDIAEREAKWWAEAVPSVLPKAVLAIPEAAVLFDIAIPPADVLEHIASSQAFGTTTMQEAFAKIPSATLNAIDAKIKSGFILGDSVESIVQSVIGEGGTANLAPAWVRTAVRTGFNSTYNEVAIATAIENQDIVKGEQWVSTLDTGTTLVCIALDGTVYPVGTGKRPPAHYGCRSRMSWVMKSAEELGLPIPDGDEGHRMRSSLTGNIPASKTYSDWFEDLTVEQQNAAVGEELATQVRAGEVALTSFANNSFDDPNAGR